jgi:hypothetical protein
MSARILPIQFFSEYCHGFLGIEMQADADEEFDLASADLEPFRSDVTALRDIAEEDGVLLEMRLALEYLIAIDDADIPANHQHVITLGQLVSPGRLSGFDTPDLHRLFEWARGVIFPDEPPMTDEDKAAAKKRVRPVEVDIDEWMEARGLERGSKPGVWAKRQAAAKRKQEDQK